MEACKRGVLFSLLSLASVNAYKNYGTKNPLPSFLRWDNRLESRVTEIGLEKTSEAPVVHPPAQNRTHIHTSGKLSFKTLC